MSLYRNVGGKTRPLGVVINAPFYKGYVCPIIVGFEDVRNPKHPISNSSAQKRLKRPSQSYLLYVTLRSYVLRRIKEMKNPRNRVTKMRILSPSLFVL